MFMGKHLWFAVVIAVLVLCAVGCSGGGNPVTPQDNPSDQLIKDFEKSQIADGRYLWGIWTVGIDPVAERCDVTQDREAAPHWDVKDFIMPPNCSNCFVAKFKGMISEGVYKIDVTLRNPTGLTGHDVRGTVFNKGVLELRNPDSYTLILTPPGNTQPKPFVAYDTGYGRPFPAGSVHTETFNVFNLFHPDYSTIMFAVDASWPGNCKEPYAVTNCAATGWLANDGSNSVKILCDVYDWQDDVQSVFVDLTAIGGTTHTAMTKVSQYTWQVEGVSYQAGGYLPGKYKALITALSAGSMVHKDTFNYVELTVTAPGATGNFVAELTNWALTGAHAPGTCLDLAVVGADDGSSYTMVCGSDWAYHLWNSAYDPATAGGYVSLSSPHQPIRRFDNASLEHPDLLDTWAWGESNDDPDPFSPSGTPPQNAPIGYWAWIWWWHDKDPEQPGNEPDKSGFIIYVDPDGVPPIATYIEPFDECGGFQRDGMQYWGDRYAAGDDTLYPYISVRGIHFPYNDGASFGFGGFVEEGSGAELVNREAVNGLDVDDMEGLDNVYVVFSEGSPENVVEVYQYDYPAAVTANDFQMPYKMTITPSAEPIDVEIFPAKNLAQDSNWICVLLANSTVEVYKISDGSLVTSFGGSPDIANQARFLDIDDLNYKIHVMQDGPQVSVFYFEPG